MKQGPLIPDIIVPGFTFSGTSSGIKKSGEKDLALIYSEKTAVAAGVFTTNAVKAAPVHLAIKNISSGKARAIVINSGNANACTGRQGMEDAKTVIAKAARELGVPAGLVYVSSTGVIGRPLPVNTIRKAVPGLVRKLSPQSIGEAASAIMTTDTFPKVSSRRIKINNKTGTVAGIAKGAGMIRPDMATMLCFIVTDIAVSRSALQSSLRESVKRSFNRLSIDNDMSTNDTAMVLANGALGNPPVTGRSASYRKFQKALNEITYDLAGMIAEDGEGATKFIEVTVKGAGSEADAGKAAMSVANSMLVKTAVYGRDPNWGRIMAALGYSGARIKEDTIDISINRIKVVRKGAGTGREKEAAKALSDRKVFITIDLSTGGKSAKALTCDLTENYIKINAHYTT